MAATPSRRYDRRQQSTPADAPYYTKASPTLLSMDDPDPPEAVVSKQEEREWRTLFEHCESRFQALYTWRVPVWTTHGQIARYMLPRRWYAWIVQDQYNY